MLYIFFFIDVQRRRRLLQRPLIIIAIVPSGLWAGVQQQWIIIVLGNNDRVDSWKLITE